MSISISKTLSPPSRDPSPIDLDFTNPTSQPISLLFSLPAELRNQIYLYLLVPPSPSTPRPNILRTCKQAYSEGTPILYGENTFTAHSSLLATLPTLRRGLRPITTPRLLRQIRRYYIHVRLDVDPRFSKSQVEESFSGAEELAIEVFQAMYASCDFSTLRLFEGVRGVKRAVVWGSVGDGAYARFLARAMMRERGEVVEPFWEEFVGGNRAWDTWTQGNR